MSRLAAWAVSSVLTIALLLFCAELVACALGYWRGSRHTRDGRFQPEGIGVVVGGLLGLLAFVLALTLSFATTRFEERRNGSLAEANAIGTAWLQATAIGGARGLEIARLLEEYAQLRRDFVAAPRDEALISGIYRQTSELQTKIWSNISAVVQARPDPVASALMASINNVFDATTAQRFAYVNMLPGPLAWLLIGMALFGAGALGYELGLRRNPFYLLTLLLAANWTVVIVVIIDLADPRIGALRTSTAAYDWTIQGFGSGTAIQPMSPSPK